MTDVDSLAIDSLTVVIAEVQVKSEPCRSF